MFESNAEKEYKRRLVLHSHGKKEIDSPEDQYHSYPLTLLQWKDSSRVRTARSLITGCNTIVSIRLSSIELPVADTVSGDPLSPFRRFVQFRTGSVIDFQMDITRLLNEEVKGDGAGQWSVRYPDSTTTINADGYKRFFSPRRSFPPELAAGVWES